MKSHQFDKVESTYIFLGLSAEDYNISAKKCSNDF